MILLVGGDGTLQDAQRQVGRGFLHSDLLQLRGHLLVSLDILRIAVDARGGEQLQTTFAQFVLQDGRSAEQRALLVEQLVDRFDDQHSVRQVLHLRDHILEAVLHLTLILGVATEGSGVQLIGHSPAQEARHMVGSQFTYETVHQRCLTHTSLTGDEQVRLGLTAEDLVDDRDLLLKANHIIQIASTCDGGLVHTILGQTALAASGRCLLRQLGTLHIGGLHIRTTTHLGTDVRGRQRQSLQLVERESHTRCHQGCQDTYRRRLVEIKFHLVVLSLVHDGIRLTA